MGEVFMTKFVMPDVPFHTFTTVQSYTNNIISRAKDLRKSLKLECKLERKLEKLESKTKKIKEKKLALAKSSDSEPCQSTSRSPFYQKVREEYDSEKALFMDAAPVTTQTVVPHMLGGEVYLHQWEVMNTGKCAWTNETTLNFTWGSKALKPLETTISVPELKPGDTGILAVRLQIPTTPGHYECYWHFHHKERRFGHWLGCQVIVDPFDLKGNMSVLETSFVSEFVLNPKKFKNNEESDVDEAVTHYSELSKDSASNNEAKYTFNIEQNDEKKPQEINTEEVVLTKNVLDNLVRDISSRVGDIKLHDPTDTNCSSDSDNQSIISLSESPDEFVVVPIPDCFKVDPIPDIPKENIQETQNIAKTKDMITDSVAGKLTPGSSKQTLVESVKVTSQQSDNYDDNNNTEGANQNSATSESALKVDDDASSNDGSQKSDIVVVSLSKEKEEDASEYAIVIVDGQKLSIPKKIIKSEYLKTSEDEASTSKNDFTRTNSATSSVEIINKEQEIPRIESDAPEEAKFSSLPTEQEINNTNNENDDEREMLYSANELLSHCSAAGSCFSEVNSGADNASRLFIFPQSCPGYEVVYPVLNVPENAEPNEYKWTDSDTNYSFAKATLPSPQMAYQNIPSAPIQFTTTTGSPPLNLSTHDRNPFSVENTVHVPNFQQTPPNMRPTPPEPIVFANSTVHATLPTSHASTGVNTTGTTTPESVRIQENAAPIHILPETLVSGAVNVASSAINTARSVINMIVPREGPNPPSNYVLQQAGRWVNGHWISTNPEAPREANLQALAEMGFWNRDLNATLLARYNDDLSRVVAELVQ